MDPHRRSFRDHEHPEWADDALKWWAAVREDVGGDVVVADERFWIRATSAAGRGR
jgi:hypothetical protein